MHFIIAAYGEDYAKFIFYTIFSILKNYPEAKGTVYWNNIHKRTIFFLQKIYPSFDFVLFHEDICGTVNQKISLNDINYLFYCDDRYNQILYLQNIQYYLLTFL